MKFRHYISIVAFLGMTFSLFGSVGENIYSVNDNNSYVFKYSAAFTEKSAINNFFLKEIAKYNLSSLYNTRFTYHYSVSKKIIKKSAYTYAVEVEVKGQKCTGNVFYKNFDVSDILMPEFTDFVLVVEENGNYIQSREFVEIVPQSDQSFKVQFEFDSQEGKKEFDLKVTDIGFYSAANDKELFYNRINQIDDYYAGLAAIDQSIERFEKLNFSPSLIARSYIQLVEFQRVYKLISNSVFINQLHLDSEKHQEYFLKIAEFETLLESYSSQYENRLSTLDYLFLSDDFSGLAEDYVDEVNYFCLLSDEATHSRQAYFYKLGMVRYSEADKEEFLTGFDAVLSRTKFKKEIETISPLFYQEILDVYLTRSNELIANQDYNLARGLLLNAKNFTLAFYEKDPPLELSIQLSKANYGIYNSYLHLIDRAIEIGNYELADNYIQKATVFQEENSSSIISNQSLKNISEELVKLYINKGFRQIKNEEFFESNYCFEQAQAKCRKIGIYNHDYVIKHGLIESRNGLYNKYVFEAQRALYNNDYKTAKRYLEDAQNLAKSYPSQIVELREFYEVKSKLMQQTYNDHISDGEIYLADGNYNKAYFELLAAIQMEDKPDVVPNKSLHALFNKVATKYLTIQCCLGNVKVKKNELDEARIIYNNCLTLQSEYGLYNEPTLMAEMSLLNADIFNEQCAIVSNTFNEQLTEIDNLVLGGEYIPALKILNEATVLSQSNNSCGIDKTSLVEFREFVPMAAEYQQLANEAQSALEKNDNTRLLELFNELDILSQRNEYIRKWIEPKPLFYLFAVKKNLAFLETSIHSYDNEQEFETAMRIMTVLESGAASGRDSKSIQISLAEKLALADKSESPTSNPSQKVEKYTHGSSYYRYFKKAYLDSWNNM